MPTSAPPMKLLLHDYGGYAFPVQLSRELASRGMHVKHVWAASNPPAKGPLAPRPGDPDTLVLEPLATRDQYDRYDFVRRWRGEREYGRLLAETTSAFRPDVMMCCNTPLDTLVEPYAAARSLNIGRVLWVQDLLGLAAKKILRRKVPILGTLVGERQVRLERSLLADAHVNVLVSEDFRPVLDSWDIETPSEVIHNWAPLETLQPRHKDNPWSREHGLADKFVFLYSGSLGLKHDPSALLALARALPENANAVVVVVSEGLGADYLRRHGAGLRSLRVLRFQPFEAMDLVLATADVLMVILDAEAGAFSVPSKTLSYLCAQRPIVAAISEDNLAARILREHRAGVVGPAGDHVRFVHNALDLLQTPDRRAELARNARAYAERHFAIGPIADRFETVLATAWKAARSQPSARSESPQG